MIAALWRGADFWFHTTLYGYATFRPGREPVMVLQNIGQTPETREHTAVRPAMAA